MGLKWHDFDARNYEASLGRWMNIDPLAEDYYEWSSYNFVYNSPLKFIDPTGMGPEWIENPDGTYTAEAGDSAWSLYTEYLGDMGYSASEVDEMVQSQYGPNNVGENGEPKSNIHEGNKVDIGRNIGGVKVYPNSANVVETDMTGRTGEARNGFSTEDSKMKLIMISALIRLYDTRPGGTKSKIRKNGAPQPRVVRRFNSDGKIGTARKKVQPTLNPEATKSTKTTTKSTQTTTKKSTKKSTKAKPKTKTVKVKGHYRTSKNGKRFYVKPHDRKIKVK